jgi:hypothetical protein
MKSMPMNQDELRKWAEVEAGDCLRYHPTLPIEEIKRIVAERLKEAYQDGYKAGAGQAGLV